MATPLFTRLRGVGWEAYIWLIYAVPFLLASFDSRLSALETTAMLIGLVVFLGLYITAQVIRGPRLLWIVGAFDLLAVIFTQRNPGADRSGSTDRHCSATPSRRDKRRSRWACK